MRTLGCAPRQSILVVPLMMKNPPSAGDQGEVPHDSLVVERKETGAESARGVVMTTRSRSRRRLTIIASSLPLPEEVLVWEIFVRLPARDMVRCRAVCRMWRRLASAADFVLANQERQPSLPLLTLYHRSTIEGGLQIFKHGRAVLGFDDYDLFRIRASCDGLLLVSLFGPQHTICNPTTRQCAPIPCLDHYDVSIAALYLHCPSREYRVLYRKDTHQYHLRAAYYIIRVQRGSFPRHIGVPSEIPGSVEVLLTFCQSTTTFAPPTLFQGCLHWDPGCFLSNDDIVVFDTVVESFRFMPSPDGATRLCTRLCDMEGSMGFSCFDDGGTITNIWVLENYESGIWSFKYHVKLPTESLCNLEDTQHLVVSHNGDVLVYSRSNSYMFRCDKNGKLLQEFQCDPWSLSISGHWFKESIVKHNFFLGRAGTSAPQPSLFHRL